MVDRTTRPDPFAFDSESFFAELDAQAAERMARLDESARRRFEAFDPERERDDELLALVADVARRDHARRNLLPFVEDVTPGYLAGWVHKDLARRLERFSDAVARGESPRLIVSMPPRHGKSCLISERFPVWHLGRHPAHHIVVASYALSLARERTREARLVAQSDRAREVFGAALNMSPDTAAKADWRLIEGGGVRAVGVQGGLTGHGAHVAIVDDPLKDAAEALSAGRRQAIWDWYRSVLYTRLMPGAGLIVVMTRWHEDDLVGRLLEEAETEGWEVVDYPAIAEGEERCAMTGEVLRRTGEALHPERYPLEVLERFREVVGSYWWRALYQGRPTSVGGDVWMRHWWRHYTTKRHPTPKEVEDGWRSRPERFDHILITGDLTFGGQGESASWVSLPVFGVLGRDLFLLEEARGRWTYPVTRTRLIGLAKRHRPRLIKIEAAAHGHALLQEIEASPELRREIGCRVEGVTPRGSKLARALAAAAAIEGGRVYLPAPDEDGAQWVHGWLDEVTAFPTGKHSDRVDSAGIAIRHLQQPLRGARPFFGALSQGRAA